MNKTINLILHRIEQKAMLSKEQLTDELADAHLCDKEAIKAGIEYENWLAESCRQSLSENR